MSKTDEQPISCSFCGKRETQARLIAGPGVYICSDCVQACCDLLREDEYNTEMPQNLPTPAEMKAFMDNYISKMKEKIKVFLSGGNRELTADFCKCMAMAFENPDQTTLNNQKSSWAWISLCTNLKFSPEFKKAFESLVDQQLEIALGIVLFQIFQQADMI